MVPVSVPDYIFNVVYSPENDEKFQHRLGDRKLLYAYHGSSVENFHSILHFGLQGHFNKVMKIRSLLSAAAQYFGYLMQTWCDPLLNKYLNYIAYDQ